MSLDPPLVAFLPDKKSSSWPKIRKAGCFCVNILSEEQEYVCRAFAVRGGDKFAGLSWRPAATGSPILEGVVAWIDCELEAVHDAGDHEIVIGRVRELDIARSSRPLLFFQGGYGRFGPLSLAALDVDLLPQLRFVDIARPHMERLARERGGECVANAVVGKELVVIASAGRPTSLAVPTRVGQRLPWMPPFGMPFVAWAQDRRGATEEWIRELGPDADRRRVEALRASVERARSRGYSVRLHGARHGNLERELLQTSEGAHPTADELRELARELEPLYEPRDPQISGPNGVRSIAMPVFDAHGKVVLALNLSGIGDGDPRALARHACSLAAAARAITAEASRAVTD